MASMDVMAAVEAVIRDEFPSFKGIVTPETTAMDVDGWDSLAHIGVIMRLERVLEVDIDPESSLSFQNIGELVSYIDKMI